MKLFALLLFIGELFAPSLMATFEAPVFASKATSFYQASVGHISTVFSETDSEERNQDDRHFSTIDILFTHAFLSVRLFHKSQSFFKPSANSPEDNKSLFALHALLLI
jgi:hypothetical protein